MAYTTTITSETQLEWIDEPATGTASAIIETDLNLFQSLQIVGTDGENLIAPTLNITEIAFVHRVLTDLIDSLTPVVEP